VGLRGTSWQSLVYVILVPVILQPVSPGTCYLVVSLREGRPPKTSQNTRESPYLLPVLGASWQPPNTYILVSHPPGLPNDIFVESNPTKPSFFAESGFANLILSGQNLQNLCFAESGFVKPQLLSSQDLQNLCFCQASVFVKSGFVKPLYCFCRFRIRHTTAFVESGFAKPTFLSSRYSRKHFLSRQDSRNHRFCRFRICDPRSFRKKLPRSPRVTHEAFREPSDQR